MKKIIVSVFCFSVIVFISGCNVINNFTACKNEAVKNDGKNSISIVDAVGKGSGVLDRARSKFGNSLNKGGRSIFSFSKTTAERIKGIDKWMKKNAW